jgi:hypothetical protein
MIGKFDLDKIPTYLNKKIKTKKTPNSSTRNHNFVDNLYYNSKSTCSKCNQAFWGIGFQGLVCQSNYHIDLDLLIHLKKFSFRKFLIFKNLNVS